MRECMWELHVNPPVPSSLYCECDEVMAVIVLMSMLQVELAMLKSSSFPEREVLQG